MLLRTALVLLALLAYAELVSGLNRTLYRAVSNPARVF